MSPRSIVIPITLLLALTLAMMPLPSWGQAFRPDWVSLVAIYWALALPHRFGLFSAWSVGLLLDISMGTLLGQHAMGMILVVYFVVRLHQRMRAFPLGQQSFMVFILLIAKQSALLWVYGITGTAPENNWLYFAPAFTGMLLWPWVFIVLRDQRRKYHLS